MLEKTIDDIHDIDDGIADNNDNNKVTPTMPLLENIKTSADFKRISREQLPRLAEQIRERIIKVVSKNGGHLASSLGAVELTLAIHHVFDLPADTLIWDVGHQAYAHKLITGRNRQFDTLRQ